MKIKIFSSDQTTDKMEKEINEWLNNNPEIISKDVVQSSCGGPSNCSGPWAHDKLTIVFMYK